MADQALSDVKVIDLSHHIAGPYCAKLLADYGAEVIKIENPNGGDIARRMGPFPGDVPHPEKSGLFLHLNTNKKSITLNLQTATGKKLLKELVKDADILVENFDPWVMPSLGLGYDVVSARNPRIIMIQLPGYGNSPGPYRDYKGYGSNVEAVSGHTWLRGYPDAGPTSTYSVYHCDAAAGGMATFVVIAALAFRARTGKGQHIDMAQQENLIHHLSQAAMDYSMNRRKSSGLSS